MVGTEFDAVLDLCSSKHRRIVLAVLAEQRRTLTVSDLAKAVLKHNHHASLPEVSGETMARIEIALHHTHLPKLVAAGIVEYDGERHLVEPTEEFDEIEPYLSAILEADPVLATPVEM